MPVSEIPACHSCVQGQLDPSWSDWLDGLAIAPQADGETLLGGAIVDLAALHGLLDKLYPLDLPIVSVAQIRHDRAANDTRT